jgi:predicted permease
MDVFTPALVFAALAGKSYDLVTYGPLAAAGVAVVLGSGLLGWPVARACGLQAKTLLPPMMFKNSGNMGLPVLLLAFGEQALPAAIVLFLVTNLLHFSFGAWLLDHHARLATLWRIPVMLAGVGGLAVSLLGIPIWPPLLLAIKMVGDIAIPLMLFSLGLRLTAADWHTARSGVLGAVLTPLAGMAAAWAVADLMNLDARQADMLLVFGALPPAVLNYMFAERYRQEPEKVAAIVLVGNVAALGFVSLALVLVLR